MSDPYIEKLQSVQATQWNQMGDHPDVQPSGNPDIPGLLIYEKTPAPNKSTAIINVYAGCWIVEIPTGTDFVQKLVLFHDRFVMLYEPVEA